MQRWNHLNRQNLRLSVAQFASRTGDMRANTEQILASAAKAHRAGGELLLCPELALTGYAVNPREQRELAITAEDALWDPLLEMSRRIGLVVGFAERGREGICHNSAAFLYAGQIWHIHRKVYLPSYGLFNEGERFDAGRHVASFDTPWGRIAMLICADAWHPSLAYLVAHEGADLLLVLTASPEGGLDRDFDTMAAWERLNQTHALTLSMYVACANVAGPEGGLRFTGGSHVAGPDGNVLDRLPRLKSGMMNCLLDWENLARQRERLPFRRVDELEITMRLGSALLAKRQGQAAHAKESPTPRLTKSQAS